MRRRFRSASRGAYDSAKTAYEKAHALDPTNPQIPYVIAQLDIANKNNKAAEADLKSAIALKQDYTDAIFLLSQLEVQDGNVKDALTSALAAAYFTPNNPNILFQVGILYAATNDYANAAAALSAAVAANPQFANARYFLSAVYAKQNDMKDALTQMQAIADMSNDNAKGSRHPARRAQGGQESVSRESSLGIPNTGETMTLVVKQKRDSIGSDGSADVQEYRGAHHGTGTRPASGRVFARRAHARFAGSRAPARPDVRAHLRRGPNTRPLLCGVSHAGPRLRARFSLVSAYVIIPRISGLDRECDAAASLRIGNIPFRHRRSYLRRARIFMPQFLALLYPNLVSSPYHAAICFLARILLLQPILLGLSGIFLERDAGASALYALRALAGALQSRHHSRHGLFLSALGSCRASASASSSARSHISPFIFRWLCRRACLSALAFPDIFSYGAGRAEFRTALARARHEFNHAYSY